MGMIKVYEKGTTERERLEKAAALFEQYSPNGYGYKVEDVYFDLGQNWIWTTIVSSGGSFGGYQALNPREHEQIVLGTDEEIERAVREALADKYCPDRVR